MGRGCRGQPIFAHEVDRRHFARVLHDVVETFNWKIVDWTLMPNHHHLLVKLSKPNLAAGMHRAHFLFGQSWNERHESTGHVMFRRYKSVALRRPEAPARVLRYIDLNPVRAGLCDRPEQWAWGGFAANIGIQRTRGFHDPDLALRTMLPHVDDPVEARPLYAQSVYDRLDATRGIGTAGDVRPSLDEIIVPGDLESVREAIDTWWYSLRRVAAHVGCNHSTLASWLRGDPSGRARRAFTTWAEQSPGA